MASLAKFILKVVFSIIIGTLLMIHLIFSLLNVQPVLAIVGLFLPPVGVANALCWLIAGTDLITYFSN